MVNISNIKYTADVVTKHVFGSETKSTVLLLDIVSPIANSCLDQLSTYKQK